MDRDLINVALDEVKAAAGDTFKFPDSLYKHIAFRMVKENCLGNSGWLSAELEQTNQYINHKRELAKKGGYEPFTFMGKSAYNWIRKNCAEWVIGAMQQCFRDPEDIHPEWAVQCAKTMSVIGREECEAQENLYEYLMSHPEWEIQKDAREQFRREWLRMRRNWEKKQYEAQHGGRRPFYQQRHDRDRHGSYQNRGRDDRRNNRAMNPFADYPSQPRRGEQNNFHSENADVYESQYEGAGYLESRAASHQFKNGSAAREASNAASSAPLGAVEGKMEVVIKFDQLPKGRPALDHQFTNFEVNCDGRIVTAEVRKTLYDKLIRMSKEGQPWIAVMSGVLSGAEGASGFKLDKPFCRIYPKKSDESTPSSVKEQETHSEEANYEHDEHEAALEN